MTRNRIEQQHRCWVELPGKRQLLVRMASHFASAEHLRPFKPGEELFVYEYFGASCQDGMRLRVESIKWVGELPVYRCIPVEVRNG